MADKGIDDTDLKIGIGRAVGITIEKLAELCSMHMTQVTRRMSKPDVQRIESIARMLAAHQSQKAAEAVARSAEDRMKKVFDKSFALTELLLEKAEAKGDDLALSDLMEIHKNLTVWSTRYTLSEAPKRVHVSGGQVHAHVFIGSLKEAENIIDTRRMLAAAQPQIEGAIEAEVVSDPAN